MNVHSLTFYHLLQDDLFHWHFTLQGPGGDYEGRSTLPARATLVSADSR